MTPKTPQSAVSFFAFRRLLKSERGAVAIVMALSLPVIMAFAGFGTEAGYWYLREAQLQGFSDTAAFAGGHELVSGSSDDVMLKRAEEEAYRSGLNEKRGRLQMFSPPTSGKYAGDADAIEVQVGEIQPRLFTKAFLKGDVPIGVRTVIRVDEWEDACVLTLDPSAKGAITTIGSASVDLDGCAMMANSVSPDAFVVAGASTLITSCVVTAGGASLGGDVKMTDCSEPQTGVKPAKDPFASLPEPIPGACTAFPKAAKGVKVTLSPGTYCGNVNVTGEYELKSGIYIFDGGNLSVNAGASFIGEEVMLAFMNGAGATVSGSATVKLRAPRSGIYSGIVIFADRDNTSTISLNGDSDSLLEGAIYAPVGDIALLGAADADSDCLVVVSATATFAGDVELSNDCSDYDLDEIKVSGILKIVE